MSERPFGGKVKRKVRDSICRHIGVRLAMARTGLKVANDATGIVKKALEDLPDMKQEELQPVLNQVERVAQSLIRNLTEIEKEASRIFKNVCPRSPEPQPSASLAKQLTQMNASGVPIARLKIACNIMRGVRGQLSRLNAAGNIAFSVPGAEAVVNNLLKVATGGIADLNKVDTLLKAGIALTESYVKQVCEGAEGVIGRIQNAGQAVQKEVSAVAQRVADEAKKEKRQPAAAEGVKDVKQNAAIKASEAKKRAEQALDERTPPRGRNGLANGTGLQKDGTTFPDGEDSDFGAMAPSSKRRRLK